MIADADAVAEKEREKGLENMAVANDTLRSDGQGRGRAKGASACDVRT